MWIKWHNTKSVEHILIQNNMVFVAAVVII